MYIYNFSPRFTRFWPPARLGDPSSVSLTDTDLDVLDNMQVNQLGEEYHLGKPVSEDQGFRLINDIREKENIHVAVMCLHGGVIQRTANKFKFSRWQCEKDLGSLRA